MRARKLWDPALAGELLCLLLAAPFLYFPGRFGVWGSIGGVALLAAGIAWRRLSVGAWFIRTPVDWPLWLWFLVLLPLAVWRAPVDVRTAFPIPPENLAWADGLGVLEINLRGIYAIPRALILVWNFCLFWVVIVHCLRSQAARWTLAGVFFLIGVIVAMSAIFGTIWVDKIPLLSPMLQQLPSPLVGVFRGAELGFSPNQVAGTLLYVLPLLIALLGDELRHARRPVILLLLSAATLVTGLVFFTMQSRTAFVGFGVSLLLLVLGPLYWGRRILLAGALLILAAVFVLPTADTLQQVDRATRFDAASTLVDPVGRYQIWQAALTGIHDYPLSGMGLGTFRRLGPLLYTLRTQQYIKADIAHAHNYFLQTALDFGLVGLIAILAIYFVAVVQGITLWREAPFAGSRWWALGLLAALGGQTVYSLADAVAMGAKTDLFAWYVLALLIGLGMLRRSDVDSGSVVGHNCCDGIVRRSQ